MKKVLVDTQILDCILNDSKLGGDLRELVHRGQIALLITHAQRDEVEAMGEDKVGKRLALLKLIDELTVIVATKGVVFGVSRFGGASFDDSMNIESLRAGRREANPTRDALIFNTATREDIDLLVSNDTRRAKRLKGLQGAPPVIGCEDFKSLVRLWRQTS